MRTRPCHQCSMFPLIRTIRTASQKMSERPSLSNTFVETLTDVTRPPRTTVPTTVKMQAAGMIIPLNNALPAVVPIPMEKPSVLSNTKSAISVVKSSGRELEIALMVPPRTPSERSFPMYSEAVSNPSHARHIARHVRKIKNAGIKIPISCPSVLKREYVL